MSVSIHVFIQKGPLNPRVIVVHMIESDLARGCKLNVESKAPSKKQIGGHWRSAPLEGAGG